MHKLIAAVVFIRPLPEQVAAGHGNQSTKGLPSPLPYVWFTETYVNVIGRNGADGAGSSHIA